MADRDPRRPADESTNPKTASVPPASLQPGRGAPVNPTRESAPGPQGPVPKRSSTRVENRTTRSLRRRGLID